MNRAGLDLLQASQKCNLRIPDQGRSSHSENVGQWVVAEGLGLEEEAHFFTTRGPQILAYPVTTRRAGGTLGYDLPSQTRWSGAQEAA